MAKKEDSSSGYRMLHLGTEFAGATLVLALIGWLIDNQYNSGPYGALIGGSIGFMGGMYLFIKEALEANKQPPAKPKQESTPDSSSGQAKQKPDSDNEIISDQYKL